MKTITKLLQHSLLKILIAPLSLIIFGIISGSIVNQQVQWLSFIQLYLLVLINELVDHFLYIHFDVKNKQQAPMFIMYACEGIFIAIFIWILMTQHLIIALLILLAHLGKILVYFPYSFSLSPYHFILKVFFNTIIWNCIAYFTQTYGIDVPFYISLIPIIVCYFVTLAQEFLLKRYFIRKPSLTSKIPKQAITIILIIIALIAAIYLSLPSQTFYLIQMLMIIILIFISVPIMIETHNHHQVQNKINYLSIAHLIFTLMYSLSYIY